MKKLKIVTAKTAAVPPIHTIDLGDGPRELRYGIDTVLPFKERFGTLQAALSHVEENLAAVIMIGLVNPGEWTEAKIARIHFSKLVPLLNAVSAALIGQTDQPKN